MTLYFEQNDQESGFVRRPPARLDAVVQRRDVDVIFAAFVPLGYDPLPPQPNTPRLGQRQGIQPPGDPGTAGLFNNAALSLSPPWQVTPQEVQPPALRIRQRMASSIRRGVDQNSNGPLVVPFREGWQIQTVQPPAPYATRTSPFVLGAGATARGDDGTQAIMVPPWRQAASAATFPDYQNKAAGAIPAWNAGPPAGSVSTLPNITAATLLKASPGNLLAVSTVVAGSTAGAVYDSASTNPPAGSQMFVLGNAIGFTIYDWPFQSGILIVPGAGQVLAAKWV